MKEHGYKFERQVILLKEGGQWQVFGFCSRNHHLGFHHPLRQGEHVFLFTTASCSHFVCIPTPQTRAYPPQTTITYLAFIYLFKYLRWVDLNVKLVYLHFYSFQNELNFFYDFIPSKSILAYHNFVIYIKSSVSLHAKNGMSCKLVSWQMSSIWEDEVMKARFAYYAQPSFVNIKLYKNNI